MKRACIIRIFCLLIAAALWPGGGPAQTTEPRPQVVIYVSPGGSDANPGSADKPLATIAAARDAVRRLRRDGAAPPASDVVMLLHGGIYTLDKPVEFGPEDSGDAVHSITYAASPGEKPILSGAPILKLKWRRLPVAAASQPASGYVVWRAELPRGSWFQELFIDGRRASRARFPAKGFITARDPDQNKSVFGYDAAAIHIPAAGRLRVMAVIRTYEWNEELLPIASIDVAAGKITLARAASYPIVPKGYGSTGQFALENLPDAICAPDQWALDADGVLTCSLADGVDPNKVEFRGASNVTLLDVYGSTEKNRFVENLHFRGLTFTQTGRIEKLEWGSYEGQAIRMREGVRDCSIRDCTFDDLGGGGITFWRTCRDITISDNRFSAIGDAAITLFDYLGEGPSNNGGNRIIDNDIHNCGTVRRDAAAIAINGSDSNLVAHNRIYDMPYIGICVNGVMPTSWQQKFAPSLKPPFTAARIRPFVHTQNNHVEFNDIHDVMQVMSDGGAIYFWGQMGIKPNFVTNNLIANVGPIQSKRTCVGIYMDDYVDDVRIRDNIVLHANFGLHLHGAPRILVENNVFAFCRVCDCSIQPEKYNTPPLQSIIRRNIFYLGTGRMDYQDTDWSKQPLKEMDYNCWWRLPEGKNLKLGFGQGFGKNSLATDPKFIDPAQPQKGLHPDSPVITKLGFHPIDIGKIGPQQ